MSSVSLESLKEVYRSEDLLADASRKKTDTGLAVDVDAQTLVLSLKDARVNYVSDKPHELYIPGQSYALSYKSIYENVRNRTSIKHGSNDLYKTCVRRIVDGILSSEKIKGLDSPSNDYNGLAPASWIERDDLFNLAKHFSKQIPELLAFQEITRNRRVNGKIDYSGLQIVQGLNPLQSVVNGYELDGVHHIKYNMLVPVPAQITASEAEFTFLSSNHAKITDNNGKIGKFAEAIVSLRNPTIHLLEIDCLTETRLKNALMSDEYIEKRSWKAGRNARVWGAILGGGIGVGLAGIAHAIGLDFSSQWYYFTAGGAVAGSFGFSKMAKQTEKDSLLDENKRREKDMMTSQTGSGLLNIAFYGDVGRQEAKDTEEISELHSLIKDNFQIDL